MGSKEKRKRSRTKHPRHGPPCHAPPASAAPLRVLSPPCPAHALAPTARDTCSRACVRPRACAPVFACARTLLRHFRVACWTRVASPCAPAAPCHGACRPLVSVRARFPSLCARFSFSLSPLCSFAPRPPSLPAPPAPLCLSLRPFRLPACALPFQKQLQVDGFVAGSTPSWTAGALDAVHQAFFLRCCVSRDQQRGVRGPLYQCNRVCVSMQSARVMASGTLQRTASAWHHALPTRITCAPRKMFRFSRSPPPRGLFSPLSVLHSLWTYVDFISRGNCRICFSLWTVLRTMLCLRRLVSGRQRGGVCGSQFSLSRPLVTCALDSLFRGLFSVVDSPLSPAGVLRREQLQLLWSGV